LLPPNFNNNNSREHLLRIPLTPPRAPSKRVVVEEKKKKKRSFYIMRLLKKSGFFEKTKTTPLYKKFSLLLFCVNIFWARFFSVCTQKNLHFISSNNKGFVSAKLFFLFVVFEDRYYTL
jgi:hypothetical protein